MKPGTLWIIRVALTVQFLGVLAVPALVASDQAVRAVWLAEWLRPHSIERSIGVLQLRGSTLSFIEQIGQVDWELDLAHVKKVATVNPSTSLRAGGGRALLVVSMTGDEYIVRIMEPDLTPGSPRRALNAIERAIELQTANGR